MMQDRVLVVSLMHNWPSSARLPRTLKAAGFDVAVAAYADSLILASRFVDRRFVLNRWLFNPRRIVAAVERWQPALVIPADEAAAELLRFFATKLRRVRPHLVSAQVSDLLDVSLGAPGFREAWGNRQRVQEIAAEAGIRTPASAVVRSPDDAFAFARSHGFPAVLKADGSYGGSGVRICADAAELSEALGTLGRAIRHGVASRAWLRHLVLRWLYGAAEDREPALSIHAYVAGTPAMRAFVARAGVVWGGLTAIAVRTHPEPIGPSTVVRLTENAEISAATEAFVRHVGYTGFGGLDFVIGRSDGHAYLIELNPRPITISHMGAQVGNDLGLALRRALIGSGSPAIRPVQRDHVIAHFPQEWYRDPGSEFIARGQIDVPWDDPPLLRALVDSFPTEKPEPRGRAAAEAQRFVAKP